MRTEPSPTSSALRLPDPRKRLKPRDVLVRAAVAELLRQDIRHDQRESIQAVVARQYRGCEATLHYLERSAVNPAMTTVVGWAAELVNTAVIDFLENDMARVSGFAQLAQRALVIPLNSAGSVQIPARASPLTLAGAWLAEGAAKPVYGGTLTKTTLTTRKLAAISAYTEEMLDRSSIEQVVHDVLVHDLSALLDSALFDATAVSSVRPAGLWNGATAVTPSALTPASEAMLADLRGLAAAVSGTGNPDASVAYVMHPTQAMRVSLVAPQYGGLITSGYMTAGNVGAIDVGAVAMTVGQPVFAKSTNAALHFNDAPLPLAATGETTIAVPARSLFQEDLTALRCVWPAGWATRRTGATALATGVSW